MPQTVEGDTKSFTIDYIDWKKPANNTYHCTAEFKVERVGYDKHYIPDIVLFVNGIPLVVIECKRSAYTQVKKKPVELAIDQLADYQARDGIPQLFLYQPASVGPGAGQGPLRHHRHPAAVLGRLAGRPP